MEFAGEFHFAAAAVYAEDEYPGIILGRELAKTLHVYIGDEITLVSPLGDLGPMGVLPRSRRFRVAAIFFSGMYEYDASHAYMKLDVAQEFLDLDHKITAIEIRVPNAENVEDVRNVATVSPSRSSESRTATTDVPSATWGRKNRSRSRVVL